MGPRAAAGFHPFQRAIPPRAAWSRGGIAKHSNSLRGRHGRAHIVRCVASPMTSYRLSARLVRVLFLSLLLSGSAAIDVSRAAAQATLTANQADYYPGDRAIRSGSALAAGQDVALPVRP